MRRMWHGMGLLAALVTSPVLAQDGPPPGRVESDPRLAAAGDAWYAAWRDAVQAHLGKVAARGTPEARVAASLLYPPPEAQAQVEQASFTQPQARTWLQQAYDAGATDAMVAWALLDACPMRGIECDRGVLLQQLLAAEPDNAEVHLQAYVHAVEQGDAAGAEAQWQAAVAAPFYRTHLGAQGRLLLATLNGVAAPAMEPALAAALGEDMGLGRSATPRDVAGITVIAVNVATAMPTLLPVTQRCGNRAGRLPAARLQECRRLYALLADDESVLLLPSVALPWLVESAGKTEAGATLRERLRRFAWIHEQALPSLAHPSVRTMPDDYAERFMRDGELTAMRHLLQANGMAAEPPPGWLPDNLYWRNLIVAGTASGR